MKRVTNIFAVALTIFLLTGCASDQKYRSLAGSDNQKLKAIKAVVNDIGPNADFLNTWTIGNKYYIHYNNLDAIEMEFNKDCTKCKVLYYTGANTIILNNAEQDYKINSYNKVYNMALDVDLGFMSSASITKSGVGLNYEDSKSDNVGSAGSKTPDWIKTDAVEASTWLYFYKIFLHQNLRESSTYTPSLSEVNKYIKNNRTNIPDICDNFLIATLNGKEETKLFITNYLKNPKSSYLRKFKGVSYDSVYKIQKKKVSKMDDITKNGFLAGIKITENSITFKGDLSDSTSDIPIWDINNHKEGE